MVLPTPAGEQYKVQGADASNYEWRVAVALDKLGLPYMFQYEVLGGRTRRGGIVLDFLVFTVPLSTPVWVNGEYWHTGEQASEDKLVQALLAANAPGEFAEPVVLWGNQLQTLDDALSAVKAAFHM